jgi:hypothetical protein
MIFSGNVPGGFRRKLGDKETMRKTTRHSNGKI